MKTKRRIKWGNVICLLGLIASGVMIASDLFQITFKFGCFTWFGLATHIGFWCIAGACYEHLEEEWRKL